MRHRHLFLLAALFSGACGELDTVEFGVEIDADILIASTQVQAGVGLALAEAIDAGTLPGSDPAQWPEDVVKEFTDQEPLEVEHYIRLDLALAARGGDDVQRYRHNIRAVHVDTVTVEIRTLTLSIELEPVLLIAGAEELGAGELEPIAPLPAGVAQGVYGPADGALPIELGSGASARFGELLALDRLQVGLRGRWTGVLSRRSEPTSGALTARLAIVARVEANAL